MGSVEWEVWSAMCDLWRVKCRDWSLDEPGVRSNTGKCLVHTL